MDMELKTRMEPPTCPDCGQPLTWRTVEAHSWQAWVCDDCNLCWYEDDITWLEAHAWIRETLQARAAGQLELFAEKVGA